MSIIYRKFYRNFSLAVFCLPYRRLPLKGEYTISLSLSVIIPVGGLSTNTTLRRTLLLQQTLFRVSQCPSNCLPMSLYTWHIITKCSNMLPSLSRCAVPYYFPAGVETELYVYLSILPESMVCYSIPSIPMLQLSRRDLFSACAKFTGIPSRAALLLRPVSPPPPCPHPYI